MHQNKMELISTYSFNQKLSVKTPNQEEEYAVATDGLNEIELKYRQQLNELVDKDLINIQRQDKNEAADEEGDTTKLLDWNE